MSWCSKEGVWGRGGQENKMASLSDISWYEDVRLQEDLRNYVRQNLKRKEMLDFLRRDFPTYVWSIPTLDRRLRYFNIFYTDTNVTLNEVKEVVGKELEGPGKLLGFRALHQKIRQEHLLNVRRDLVYTHVGFVTRVMWVAQLFILQSNKLTCNEFIFRMACHRGAA